MVLTNICLPYVLHVNHIKDPLIGQVQGIRVQHGGCRVIVVIIVVTQSMTRVDIKGIIVFGRTRDGKGPKI